MTTYLYPHGWEGEGHRLVTLESLWDPASIARLAAVGIGSGWNCLEVGAGAGSIARWMAAQVGEAGHVTALDIDVTHLGDLARTNVTVMQHDVTRDPLERDAFDLVHARLLLKHLPARDQVVATLVTALRPGGWLVVEDTDWTGAGTEPHDPAFAAVLGGLRRLTERAGGVHDYGRQLAGVLRAAGLVEVGAEGTLLVLPGGTPRADLYRLTFAQIRERLLDAGLVDVATYGAALAVPDDPASVALAPVLIGAHGQKAVPDPERPGCASGTGPRVARGSSRP